jgi:hypothetical protein
VIFRRTSDRGLTRSVFGADSDSSSPVFRRVERFGEDLEKWSTTLTMTMATRQNPILTT